MWKEEFLAGVEISDISFKRQASELCHYFASRSTIAAKKAPII